jgi:hypothetical protein
MYKTIKDTNCPNCGLAIPKGNTPHWAREDCSAALRAELDATRAELAALKAAQQWRPVTALPDAPDWYLTYSPATGQSVQQWHDGMFHSRFHNQPTHWLPLPPPPDAAGV